MVAVVVVVVVVAIAVVEDNVKLILQTPNGDILSNISNLLLVGVAHLRDLYRTSDRIRSIGSILRDLYRTFGYMCSIGSICGIYTVHLAIYAPSALSAGFIPYI
ncbi:hypothetical protein [Paenibacillus odorifer]|uniref:hypothetical protein n=1 Tax=Paenibacillus odorifer TaxID=189426 RepID=UPI0020BE94EB|nr:hypothetical protein [Paenibacillus odorifer]